jgi:hypothetical protein
MLDEHFIDGRPLIQPLQGRKMGAVDFRGCAKRDPRP